METGDVARRGQAQARHDLQDRHVPHAVVAGPVVPGDPGPVEHERHTALVQRDVHQHLVERAIEEGRVDREHRVQPAHGEPGCGGDGVLLGDADVEGALGELPGEGVEPDRVHHRGGDGHDVLAALAELDDGLGEVVGPDLALRLLRARLDVEGPGGVELVGLVAHRGVVALALAGQRVHDDRPTEALRLGQRVLHRDPVVAVDGSDVLQAEVLEEALRCQGVLHALLHRVERVVGRVADPRHLVEALLDQVEDLLVARVRAQRGQRGREAADGRGVGALVVVDHDHQAARPRDRDVVEGLPGHAAGQGAVTDDGDHVAVVAADGVRLGEAVGVGQRGGGVGVLHDVVVGLGLARVAADAALLAQRGEVGVAAGDELVHVGLVAGVEDDAVVRGLEDAVDRERQLDHAEVRAEVSGVGRDRADHHVADLRGELVELLRRESTEVARGADRVEECHGA